jgi:hypothetical protein
MVKSFVKSYDTIAKNIDDKLTEIDAGIKLNESICANKWLQSQLAEKHNDIKHLK